MSAFLIGLIATVSVNSYTMVNIPILFSSAISLYLGPAGVVCAMPYNL